MARILLVDDDPLILRAYSRVLRAHDTTQAENPEDALDFLAKGEIDMLVTDNSMPLRGTTRILVDQGLALLSRVKTLYPTMPAIMISGDQRQVLRDSVEEMGYVFLDKPFTPVELKYQVASQLEKLTQ